MSPQMEYHSVPGGCRHLRGRYRVQPTNKLPFPERRLVGYECEMGIEIGDDEELGKCQEPRVECWKPHGKHSQADVPEKS
jgi:hypothetical protein